MKSNKKIGVIGAGFVGLAHSVFLSKEYKQVVIYDRDEDLIKRLKEGNIDIFTEDKSLKKQASKNIKNGSLLPSNQFNDLRGASIIFFAIGLDFKNSKNGYENLNQIFRNVSKIINKQTLLVLETTVPPGTVDNFILPSIFKGNKKFHKDNLRFVYSYERVMPGPEYMSSLKTLPKVFGALNDSSKRIYKNHLKKTLPDLDHICLKNIVSAEYSKVMENTYRMVNIALIGELTNFGKSINADVSSILEAIRKRPTHSNIRYPGQAPGGYCLTKDPDFLLVSNDQMRLNEDLNILKASSRLTKKLNKKVEEYVEEVLDKKLSVCFLGLSYRSGVGDLRESSSLDLALSLNKKGYINHFIDPFVNQKDLPKCIKLSQMIKGEFDQAVLSVRHNIFDLKYLKSFKTIIDINSCLSVDEREYLKNQGLNIFQYGDFA